MNTREAIEYMSDPENWLDIETVKRARSICSAACDVWEARRAVIVLPTPIESHGPAWVAWRTEQTRLALELSKAEAALIALEDAKP